MRQVIFILLFFFLWGSLNAQTKSEDEWANIYQPQEWKAIDYVAFIDTIRFKPIKTMKNYAIRDIKASILSLTPDYIRQMNITGSYYCSVKHEDMFQLWNLYYPTVSKYYWDIYCKGFIALMDLDGFIIR